MRKILLASIFAALAACGGDEGGENDLLPTAGCSAQSAMIGVYDGLLRIFCGCAEAAGTVAVPPQSLTCTISSGTMMVFFYDSPATRHQILSIGSPSFVSSPIYDPEDDSPVQTHSVVLNSTGTYSFVDAFQSNLGGQVIVQ